ncbi:DUF1566 domain-containing protein [Oligoflexaceae bacterium]|nr:DUF1566 domain-containing protein [Oligoflexaceae bacterium]
MNKFLITTINVFLLSACSSATRSAVEGEDQSRDNSVSSSMSTSSSEENVGSTSSSEENVVSVSVAPKLNSENCEDPDLSKLATGQTVTLCNGSTAEGTYTVAADLDPWDVRHGVEIGSTIGKLKFNCRNTVGNYDGSAYEGGSLTAHMVTDRNYDGSGNGDFPSTNPWNDDAYFCGYNDPVDPSWERVITAPATTGSGSIFLDKISKLMWTRGAVVTGKDWNEAAGGVGNGAAEYCDGSTHGGYSEWRLPTQKELIGAYQHGIRDLDSDFTPTDNLENLDTGFWSSTTVSSVRSKAFVVVLSSGVVTDFVSKTSSSQVLCISSE